jgi:hypothetical protein
MINHGTDIDISSAYGTCLRKLKFTIGRPRIYSTTFNQSKSISLHQFLINYASKLKKGLYKIVVTGKLSFSQDIIFSKLTS